MIVKEIQIGEFSSVFASLLDLQHGCSIRVYDLKLKELCIYPFQCREFYDK